MPVPGVGEISTFSGGGTDYSGLHSALLAVKVWSSGAAAYVWSGDGLAPDPLSYTQILFVDPTGTHDPTTTPGGRTNANDLWETGGLALGVAPGGSTGQVLTKNSATSYDTGWATPSGGGGSGLGGIIALVRYNPSSEVAVSTSSTTFADVDATNLAVTFTAPSTGKVLIELDGFSLSQSNGRLSWNLREGSTNLTGTAMRTNLLTTNNNGTRAITHHYVSGLTASSSHTYKWGHACFNGGAGVTYYGQASDADMGAAFMTVWSLP